MKIAECPCDPQSEDPNPISLACKAFAAGQEPDPSSSCDLLRALPIPGMNWMEAWQVCRKYAAGLMDEAGFELKKVVQAWIILGKEQFETIFTFTQAACKAIRAGMEEVRRLAQQVRRSIGRTCKVSLKALVNAILRNFGHLVPLAGTA